MVTILLCIFIQFVHTSDQDELITKFSDDIWHKTPAPAKQHLLALDSLVKNQQSLTHNLKGELENLKKNHFIEILRLQQQIEDLKQKQRSFEYVLNPDCRNDRK
jgi:hypothetical protein